MNAAAMMHFIDSTLLILLIVLTLLLAAHAFLVYWIRRRNHATQEALRQRNQELTLLYKAGHELSSTLELPKIYNAIYHFISGVMPCESLYVTSYTPDDQLMRCLYAWGDGQAIDVSQLPPIPLEPEGKGTQSLVIRTGEPLFLPDYIAQLRTATTSYLFDEEDGHVVDPEEVPEDADRPRSAILVPLKQHGQVIGVMQVFSTKLAAFTLDDLRLLESLAIYVTAALTNAFLYQQAQTEINERKQAEKALRESEEKFRTFIQQSCEEITLLDEQGRVIEWNAAREQGTGLSRDEVIGRPYIEVQTEMVSPEARSEALLTRAQAAMDEALKTGDSSIFQTSLEVELPMRNGGRRIIAQSIFPIKTEQGYRIGSITRDITKQKRAEVELHRRDTILEAVSIASRLLLEAVDWRQETARMLEALSQACGADRSSIVRFEADEQDQNKLLASTHYLWMKQAAPPDEARITRLDVQEIGLGFVVDQLSQNQPVIYHVKDLAPAARKLYEQYGLISILHLPIFIYGKLWGSMHFGATQNEREWSKPEVEALKIAADMLGTVIERKQAEQELELYKNRLEELVNQRTAELQQVNEQLVVLSHIKDEFVSNVSHELRTPITSIKLRQYLLEKHPEQLNDHLVVIGREIERLAHTIENLLQLSRLDQARVALLLAPVNLNALVEQLIQDRGLLLRHHNLSLVFESMPELPYITGDAELLGQVFSILLTNAINYTPPAGTITVQICRQKTEANRQWVGFRIADTGVGIPEHEQAQLFTRFYRGGAGRKLGIPGTGLGLSIAKEIVDRHHGKIEIVSDGIAGHGTVFTVWLPILETA